MILHISTVFTSNNYSLAYPNFREAALSKATFSINGGITDLRSYPSYVITVFIKGYSILRNIHLSINLLATFRGKRYFSWVLFKIEV